MEKHITDERTGLRYELIGDIYYLEGDKALEIKQEPIGVWVAAAFVMHKHS